MEETTFRTNSSLQKTRSRSKFVIFFIAGIILIVGSYAGWQFFGIDSDTGSSEESLSQEVTEPSSTPAPTSTAEASPTSTPEPTSATVDGNTGLDRADLTIEIQNGSGVEGAAGRASDFLEDLGYDVIEVGNADSFDYEETFIQVKSSAGDYLSLLENDLGGEYSIGNATDDLSASSNADALIIIVE